MTESNDLVVIMMPPYPQYETAPADQSHSELRDCPKCKNKCWLSKKKKGALMFSSCIGKEILLACYDCITKMAKDGDPIFAEGQVVEL